MKVIGYDERGCPIWKPDNYIESKEQPKEVKASKVISSEDIPKVKSKPKTKK
jgi:hypothetical protein